MDGGHRSVKRPLEMRREFVGCRVEAQVLVRAYELAVPVVRRQVKTVGATPGNGAVMSNLIRTGRVALGA